MRQPVVGATGTRVSTPSRVDSSRLLSYDTLGIKLRDIFERHELELPQSMGVKDLVREDK